ncbi:MAG TPA: hypothetical protein VNT52_08660, partial [Acidimicrobiales bacterium]|nr:hypothetical protein [Acidimicrobiales bacterium]
VGDEDCPGAGLLLVANREVLDTLASALASAETLQGDRLHDHLDGVQRPASRNSHSRAPAGASNSSARDGDSE